MSFAAIIALLTGVAKAIPALASMCEQAIGWLKELDEKRNAEIARQRKSDKDAAVDAAIDGVLSPKTEQQSKAD